MSNIRIVSTTVTTEVEVVLHALRLRAAEAQLLGKSGVELERFSLINGTNHLSLKNHPPGTYALRINTGNEVTVREIVIEK